MCLSITRVLQCWVVKSNGSVNAFRLVFEKSALFALFIFWSLLLNRDNGNGVSSYCTLVSTAISRWAKMMSQLNNFSESSCIFFSLTKGDFLSYDRAFIFDLTSIVDVTDCPYSLICISIPTSAALSALFESSTVLVNPVEKYTCNALFLSLSNDLISSNHFRTSSTASVSRFICVCKCSVDWKIFTVVLLHPLVPDKLVWG